MSFLPFVSPPSARLCRGSRDTLVVRTILVPALVHDLGPRAWWPGRIAADHAKPAPPKDSSAEAA